MTRELGRQSRRMQAQLDEVVRVGLRERRFDAGLEALFESRQPIVELLRLTKQTEYEIFGVRMRGGRCHRHPPAACSISASLESHSRMLTTTKRESVDAPRPAHHWSGSSVLGPTLRLSHLCNGAAARHVVTI